MKKRTGYVSNSSSSSFIVRRDLYKDYRIPCVRLTDEQRHWILTRMEDELKNSELGYYTSVKQEDVDKLKTWDEWWLTAFLYDEGDRFYENEEHVYYSDGEMSGMPYDDECFNCLTENPYDEDGVWIYKSDDKNRKLMTITEFCKELRKRHKGKNLDVVFGRDIVIRPITPDDAEEDVL